MKSEEPAVSLYIPFFQTQQEDSRIHNPAACLPGAGWQFVERTLQPLRYMREKQQTLEAKAPGPGGLLLKCGSRSILRKAIAFIYDQGNFSPAAKDIIREFEKVPDTGRIGGWKVTAMRALESLEFADILSNDRISQEQLAEKMLQQNTVIELDALAAESKKFLIPILSLWLYYVRLKSSEREKLKLVIFIEEAHHVLHKRPQTANETVKQIV